MHIHHFCTGINLMNRALLTANPQHRWSLLQGAHGELRYVVARWPDGFALTEEARQRKAEVEFMLTLTKKRR